MAAGVRKWADESWETEQNTKVKKTNISVLEISLFKQYLHQLVECLRLELAYHVALGSDLAAVAVVAALKC